MGKVSKFLTYGLGLCLAISVTVNLYAVKRLSFVDEELSIFCHYLMTSNLKIDKSDPKSDINHLVISDCIEYFENSYNFTSKMQEEALFEGYKDYLSQYGEGKTMRSPDSE